jgi:hypothetical protein
LSLFAPAQRGIFHNAVSLGQMDAHHSLIQLTVEEILKKWPKTYVVFRNRNTDCIGCLLQKFCSVQDVADTYEVSPQDLIHDFEKCIDENYASQRSI